jgi:hypothetical protein
MTKLVKEQDSQSYHTKSFESIRHIEAKLVGVFISSIAQNGKSVEDEMVKNLGRGVRGLASQTWREAGIPLLSGV